MSSHTLSLLDLPFEIFKTILAEAVRLRALKHALRLRLVNKLFSDELVEALCVSNLIDECWVKLSEWPYVRPYVEKRLLERRTVALPRLHSIRKTAEQLAAQDGTDFKYKEYALRLLQLASTSGCQDVRQLLVEGPGIYEERRFNYDLLTAAAFTNHFSLVRSLADTHLWIDAGTFGDPFTVAVQAGNYYVLAIFFAIDLQKNILGIRGKIGLLRTAIEYGDRQMVEYILLSDCNPLKLSSVYGARPKRWRREMNTLLHTPHVEIFHILLAELQSRRLTSLDDKLLLQLLRSAIRYGWTNMTRHIILLGAPLHVPIRNGWASENPLYYACRWGHAEVVKVLLDHGAQTCGSELEAAASRGHTSIVEILLKSGTDVHATAAKDCLYAAARKGFVDVVQMLLDSGMDPNRGDTAPLVGAVESEHIAMFRMLVQRGAIVARVLPEATRRAEAAGLESMLALLHEYETPGSMEQLC